MEGDVFFPEQVDSYLGFVYNFQRHGAREDFGLIYLKGDGNYLQANPHRDYNVSRTLYPEYMTRLTGASAVHPGAWQHFKIEVVGKAAHVFIGDMQVPRMTFDLADFAEGSIGLQPRSVGGEVWVDNIVVSSIAAFTYNGAPLPQTRTDRDSLITDWRIAGPFTRTRDEIAQAPTAFRGWRPFAADDRGAVVTGKAVDYHGERTVAYFSTEIRSEKGGAATLHISSVDDLALWMNGRFAWFIPRGDAAWYDARRAPDHAGRKIPLDLQPGLNTLVLRVRGGVYASGGFFASVEPRPAVKR